MISKQYIAGFIDGEGCISIRKTKAVGKYRSSRYDPTLYIANTNKEVLEEIRNFFGSGTVDIKSSKTQLFHPKWKTVYRYQGSNIIPILDSIRKYLIVKKPIANKICEYSKYFGYKSYKRNVKHGRSGMPQVPEHILNKRIEIYDWCKNFNKRGN